MADLKKDAAHRRNAWPVALLGLSLLFVYYPVFLSDYARLDTFNIFANVYFGRFPPWTSWLAIQGRPLASFFTWLFYSPLESLSGLQFVRFVGLLGTCVLGILLYRTLGKFGWFIGERYCLALAICCIPGIAVFTGWSICFTFTWGAALAVWGGWLCTQWQRGNSITFGRPLAGCVSVFLSLWIYQPSALFGLIPILMAGLSAEGSPRKVAISGGIPAGLFMVSLGSYYIAYKAIFLRFMPDVGNLQSRLEQAHDFVAQIRVVLDRAIPESAEGWLYFFDGKSATFLLPVFAGILMVGSIVSLWRFGWKNGCIKGGFVLFALAVSLIPILYLSTGIPYYRMMGPFTAICFLLLAGTLRIVFPGKSAFAGMLILVLATLLQAGGAAVVMRQYWINPAERELDKFRQFVRQHVDSDLDGILVISSERWIHGPGQRRYQFGFLSTNQAWIMEPMARLLVSEVLGREAGNEVPVLSANGSIDLPYLLSLDANRIMWDEKRPWRTPTNVLYGFGEVFELRQGPSIWLGSPWFGPFQWSEKAPKQLRHLVLGEVEFGWDGDELHLNTPSNSWVHTNKARFPLATRSHDGVLVRLAAPAGE